MAIQDLTCSSRDHATLPNINGATSLIVTGISIEDFNTFWPHFSLNSYLNFPLSAPFASS